MRFTFVVLTALVCASASWAQSEGKIHQLKVTPQTVAWGYYDAKAKPVLTIASGDVVEVDTLLTNSPAGLRRAGVPADQIQQSLRDVYDQVKDKGPGGHILTGPIFIEGAELGDVLEVRIQKIALALPYAYNAFSPRFGFLPEDFTFQKTKIIPLDREKMLAHFSPGIDIPLHPFFGSMGVAPDESAGRISSVQPGTHAGNMDNKHLVEGTTLSAVDGVRGEPRQPYLDKLVKLCADCDRRGMIADITFTRGKGVGGKPLLSDAASLRRAVETVTKALAGTKNWYLDLSNERNIHDARHTSMAELADLREAVRNINPNLLVTASHGGDASHEEVLAYLNTAHLDFVSIHRPRDPESAAHTVEATREYRTWIQQNGRIVPLMYDEPFRRGYANWEPKAQDFSNDLKASRDVGAAGWCFHNGDTRKTKDHEPRRSFDLRTRSLFDQLDVVEKKFLANLPNP